MSLSTSVAALAVREGEQPRRLSCQIRVVERLSSKCGQERTSMRSWVWSDREAGGGCVNQLMWL